MYHLLVGYHNIRDNALELAKYHGEVEPELQEVRFYPDPGKKEIRLLEIVAGSTNSDEVLPFRFSPDPPRGVYFPVVIVELSPQEYQRLRSRQLHLPDDWQRVEDQSEVIWSRGPNSRQ